MTGTTHSGIAPVRLSIFIVQRVALSGTKLSEIYKGATPYTVLQLIGLLMGMNWLLIFLHTVRN